ncbi:transmembrane protein 238-like [Carcharodon carcharias]|uniref:transmembrane protein 238-like n=1 Tax=Carcharodon carcharias TaxID=13397 RepID=UPI001B7EE55B|nr:transmembrane protein 238-like [Carcharodon carcharias]
MALTGLNRCTYALCLAVVLDAVGLVTLLVGIFGNLQWGGRDYGDMLIYTGAIVVFASLIGWVFWYTGNIEITWEELGNDYHPRDTKLQRIVRKISRSISMRNGEGRITRAGTTRDISPHPKRGDRGHQEERGSKAEEPQGGRAMD